MNKMIDRRTLLQASAALIVAFSFPLGRAGAQTSAAKTVSPERVDGYLAIATDGHVTVYSGKVDLGTGVRTALTQMVAEELDVPMSHVTIIEGDTALTPDQGTTSGDIGTPDRRARAGKGPRRLCARSASR